MCGCGGSYPAFVPAQPNLGAASSGTPAPISISPVASPQPSQLQSEIPVQNAPNTYVLPPSGGAGTPS